MLIVPLSEYKNRIIFMYTNRMKTIFLFIVLSFLNKGPLFGQEGNQTKLPVTLSIPAKASLAISGTMPSFSVSKDISVKHTITPSNTDNIWINYSSVVEQGATNSICASLNPGNLPAEITIQLTANNYKGSGFGRLGKPTLPILLSTNPQPIITEIGTCFTGKGINNGHALSFSWILDAEYDPEIISLEGLQIVAEIVYTIISN